MFKILLFFFVSVAWVQAKYVLVVPPQEVVPKLMETAQSCIAESGVEPGIFDKVVKGSYGDDLATKKYLQCFLEKGGYDNGDGYFNKEKVMEVVGKHEKAQELGQAVDVCNEEVKKENHEDKYDLAYALFNCLHKSTPVKLKIN